MNTVPWQECAMLCRHICIHCALNIYSTEGLVELLVFVCERCPALCTISHVPTLLGAYSATCTRTGRGHIHCTLSTYTCHNDIFLSAHIYIVVYFEPCRSHHLLCNSCPQCTCTNLHVYTCMHEGMGIPVLPPSDRGLLYLLLLYELNGANLGKFK